MKEIKTLFCLIFFSKIVVLTETPINLSEEWTTIYFAKPVTAITAGATIKVEFVDPNLVSMSYLELNNKFPPKTVFVKLYDTDGYNILLKNTGGFSFGNNGVWMIIDNKGSIIEGKKYYRIDIKSKKNIENVKIIWENSRL